MPVYESYRTETRRTVTRIGRSSARRNECPLAVKTVGRSAALAWRALRWTAPRAEGEQKVAGIGAPVAIRRDACGIPHIDAASERDAFFAQGYCHAQDRLWQIELNRRVASGRLAEVFGPDALELDRLMRRLGLHRAAAAESEGAPSGTIEVLTAYAAGVNACIKATPRRNVPVEFRLARFRPEEWEPLDSLAIGRLLAFSLSPNWGTELVRWRIARELGVEQAARLEEGVWSAGAEAVPLIDGGAVTGADGAIPEPSLRDSATPVQPPRHLPGSNSFVIAGPRSASGLPLLANDVHLIPQMPSALYEAHLRVDGGLDVAGATVPGLPGVVIGHNRRISWGITSSMVDVADFFIERPDPEGLPRTAYEGGWSEGRMVSERIDVKGRALPHFEDVLVTERHGPLLTPTAALPVEGRPLALRSMVLEPCQTVEPLLDLNRATNWDEFRSALAEWVTPSFNFTYADVEGNIGYQMAGRVPVRRAGEGLIPSPGWVADFEWNGTVGFEDLPCAFNPDDGLWATANHDVSALAGGFLSREFFPPVRYRRIRTLLESKAVHSTTDLAAVQRDRHSAPLAALARAVAAHVEPASDLEREVVGRLETWDGNMAIGSSEASVCELVRLNLVTATAPATSDDVREILLGRGPNAELSPVSSFYFLQGARVLSWLSSLEVNGPQGAVLRTLQGAFSDAVGKLRYEYGNDVSSWGWGRLHALTLPHALSVRPPLGPLFNIGPFPCPGNLDSIEVSGPLPGGGGRAGGPIPAYRLIADPSDWDATLSCLPGGQSGHRASPHYADQIPDWRAGRYHRLPFTRPAVTAQTSRVLRLSPEVQR